MNKVQRSTNDKQVALLRLHLEHRRKLTLRSFATKVYPKFEWFPHCEILADKLESVVTGDIKRLMVFEPPRHGKSQLISRIFPAYYLYKHPEHWVGVNSYSASLAHGFSRNARDFYQRFNRKIKADADQISHWETLAGGGLWAAGVGGPITGKGFHLGIIDDPLKNAEEASSAIIRAKQKDWYQSTFYTREEPNGAIILVMTRWDEDDLAGWLLEEEINGEQSECWHIVNFPAIKDKHNYLFPDTCTVEPDDREIGQPLCPERYNAETLKAVKGRIGEYYWEALYQGRPLSTIGKGRVYQAFERGKNVAEVEDTGGTLLVGMDFNVDPMSAIIGVRAADQFHQLDEIIVDNSNTEEMACEIKERFPDRKIVVYPDPSGRSRRTSAPAGQTDFKILKQAGFTVVAPKAAPPVVDRINEVNRLCGEKEHPPRYFVHPWCVKTIQAMERHIYKPGTSQPDKGKGYDHITDALGYLIHCEFPIVHGEPAQMGRIIFA